MLYETKQGSKAYEYIKGVLDAEEKEYQAYIKRVEEAVGFEFQKYKGCRPNSSLTRKYEIDAILVHSEQCETLDKKVWKMGEEKQLKDGCYVAVAPNKRCKKGIVIASVLSSYKAVTNHFKVLKELEIEEPKASSFSITQLLRHKDRIFAFFDDSIRAEKCNPDFKEITIGEYEDLFNSNSETEV